MSFEVEIKFRVADHEALANRLAALGAVEGTRIDQEDMYLGHPGRDFAQTNEALRLRREGDENRITYKGPKLAGPTKTREEIELEFAGGPDGLVSMGRLFEILGFRPVAVVRKVRRPFQMEHRGRSVTISLDVTEGLGPFVEVECLAAGQADLGETQAAVLDLAQVLGLKQVEPRSYLRMTLEHGIKPT
jgi:adenylate cyclase class 2